MDPIVDDGQSREHFWLRVIRNYNNFYGNLRERTLNQVISWWQKINVGVQKFKDHYKQVVDLKKNGYKKSDVMIHAYVIWKEDEGNNFALKHAWWLLKDQPKWLEQCTWIYSKRTKLYAFGAYSSSSNPEISIEVSKIGTPSRIPHPMG